jgi:hypothetical protein
MTIPAGTLPSTYRVLVRSTVVWPDLRVTGVTIAASAAPGATIPVGHSLRNLAPAGAAPHPCRASRPVPRPYCRAEQTEI